MNNYVAHPSSEGEVHQRSSLADKDELIAVFASTKWFDRPFVITEYRHVYWNRHRYEQAFLAAGYAAFQGFDGMGAHASPVSVMPHQGAGSFRIYDDPIAVASELMGYFLFRRGDVSTARHRVRITIPERELDTNALLRDGFGSAQQKLALMTGFGIECVADGKPAAPALPGEWLLPASGSSRSVVQKSFVYTVGSDRELPELVRRLRERGILPPQNRSDGHHCFESDNGELFFDAARKRMEINSPRFQGLCAEAGATVKLPDFEPGDENWKHLDYAMNSGMSAWQESRVPSPSKRVWFSEGIQGGDGNKGVTAPGHYRSSEYGYMSSNGFGNPAPTHDKGCNLLWGDGHVSTIFAGLRGESGAQELAMRLYRAKQL